MEARRIKPRFNRALMKKGTPMNDNCMVKDREVKQLRRCVYIDGRWYAVGDGALVSGGERCLLGSIVKEVCATSPTINGHACIVRGEGNTPSQLVYEVPFSSVMVSHLLSPLAGQVVL